MNYQNNSGFNTYDPPPQKQPKGLAIAALIIGIAAIVLSCCYGGFIGVVGIILGIVHLRKTSAGKGMAIAGIIMSAVGLIISLVWIIILGASLATLDWDSISSYASY